MTTRLSILGAILKLPTVPWTLGFYWLGLSWHSPELGYASRSSTTSILDEQKWVVQSEELPFHQKFSSPGHDTANELLFICHHLYDL